MYQATLETDHLIVKSIDTHTDSDTRMNKNYFGNSKIMYVIYFIASCFLIFTTFSVMFKHYGNESELTFQGTFIDCTKKDRAYDFAIFKGFVQNDVNLITIHGLWPQSPNRECQSCVLNEQSNIPSK